MLYIKFIAYSRYLVRDQWIYSPNPTSSVLRIVYDETALPQNSAKRNSIK